VEAALAAVQSLDPARRRARCARVSVAADLEHQRTGGVAWQIVSSHMRLLETRQYKEMARLLGRPSITSKSPFT